MDYSNLGFGPNFIKKDSIPGRPLNPTGMQFDSQYEVQTNSVLASSFVNNGFIDLSDISTASGTLAIGSQFVLNVTLSPDNPPPGYLNFGVPLVSIYEGTSIIGSMEFYPRSGGGQPSTDKFHIYSGLSWNQTNGTNSVFSLTCWNNSGSAVPFYIVTQWKYTDHGRPN